LRNLQRRFVSNAVSNVKKLVNLVANRGGQRCYDLAKIGRQKALVNRKYGHDTQGVAGSSPARPTKVPGQA
jgi:hypothetical protein